MKIKGTRLLRETREWLQGDERLLVHAGGTRSSKTWSCLQALILYGLETPGTTIDVYRAEQAVARRTIQQDLIEILDEQMGIYDEESHHKTDAVYTLPTQSEIRLRGADQSSKQRGSKRHLLYVNEAQEMPAQAWKQLKLRTTGKIIIDYNPSFDADSIWIGEAMRTSAHTLLRSTYEDNPFLTQATIKAIESLVPVYEETGGARVRDEHLQYSGDGVLVAGDPSDWSIYGRAEYRRSPLLLLPHYEHVPDLHVRPQAYGLDFGYTAPSALVAIEIEPMPGDDKDLCKARELIYEKQLTTKDLIHRLDDLSIDKDLPMYCDSAEPDRIEQLQRAGYDAQKAKKDIKAGLDCLRGHRLQINGAALNKEISSYQRKHKDSDLPRTGQPDHLCDSLRYAAFSHTTAHDPGNITRANHILSTLG